MGCTRTTRFVQERLECRESHILTVIDASLIFGEGRGEAAGDANALAFAMHTSVFVDEKIRFGISFGRMDSEMIDSSSLCFF